MSEMDRTFTNPVDIQFLPATLCSTEMKQQGTVIVTHTTLIVGSTVCWV